MRPHPDWYPSDPHGIWQPYTQMAVAPPPIPVERAEGAYLYTSDGRAIFDAISSWWVTLHGHCEPRMARAIAEQAARLDQVIFAGFTHEPAARLAARLVEITPPGLGHVFYSDDGSTAVEAALKMAYQHWRNRGEEDRTQFVTLEGAYHGDTFGAMAVGGGEVFHGVFRPLMFETLRVPSPYGRSHPAGGSRDEIRAWRETEQLRAAEALDALLHENHGRVAAFIVEPMVQGAGGMIMWPAEFLRRAREVCNRHDVLLIADEVFTGFGRTGPLFACEHAGVVPDILCLSKAITGGVLPLAATLASDAVYESFLSEDRSRTLFHGHSFTGNPIACAAALASLELLEERGLRRVAEIEAIHRERLAGLDRREDTLEAKALGLIARIEIGTASGGDAGDDDAGYLASIGPRLAKAFLARDVLLRPLGNVVYLVPPLAASDDDLHNVYDVIGEVFDELL